MYTVHTERNRERKRKRSTFSTNQPRVGFVNVYAFAVDCLKHALMQIKTRFQYQPSDTIQTRTQKKNDAVDSIIVFISVIKKNLHT